MARIGSAYLQFVAAFAATLAYLTCGTLTGWPSPTIPRLQGNGSHIPLSPDEGSWIVASFSLTMLLPLVPVAFAVDVLGRKVVLAATALPFVASWLIVVFANSATDLVVSRVVASIGFGTVLTVGPMYMGEIAEDRIRGAIGTIFMSMMNAGTLLEYCVGPYLSFVNLAYVSLVAPALFFATFVWMPESPYFLLMRGRRQDAEASLLRLRGLKEPSAVKHELESMEASLRLRASDGGGAGSSLKELFLRRGNRRSLLLCWGLMFFQMCSGILAFLAYATDIFIRSGSSLDADVSAMVLGVVQLLGGVVASSLVDRAGRRPLLLVSCVGCAASLATEGCFFYLKDVAGADVSGIGWLPLAALIAFLMSYSLGLGPVPWAIVGEIFPPLVKGPATSLVTVSVAVLSFGVTKLFQVLADDFGAHVAFWVFAACCTLGVFFTLLAVPETKGKSLLEITTSMDEEFLFCCSRTKQQAETPSSRKMIVAKTTSSSADCSCCHLLEDGTRLCCGQHEV